VYFNVNFNVLFKLIEVHFLVSKLYFTAEFRLVAAASTALFE